MQSGLDDIGNTYVEIDYTSQHLWYYKDGSLVTDTGIVSGNISRETAHRMASLRLHTNRKMPHLSAKIMRPMSDISCRLPTMSASTMQAGAAHLAKRSTKLPVLTAVSMCLRKRQKLFQTLQVGTPVIAYYREPVTLTAENTRISNAYSYKAETGL